jgi:hypothetical protein
MVNGKSLGIGWLVLVCFATCILACQVPVFRYALERWDSDAYQIQVLYQERLDPNLLSEIELLNKSAGGKFPIAIKSLSDLKDPKLQSLWDAKHSGENAAIFVTYPNRSASLRGEIAHSARFTLENLKQVLDSPVRKSIEERLLSGESATWILLESGNREKDNAALALLQENLARLEKEIQLPTVEELDISPELLARVKIKLEIKFSLIQLRRDDPRERFLVDALIHSEADLAEYSEEPIVFPVFGRGIVLYALVGPGIDEENIREAAKFLAGPCSCQVKEQNPGFDLLFNTDWSGRIGSVMISQPIPGSDSPPKLLTIPPGKKTK